ncbi:hypothetical protein [Streptococcus porci]|uniref:hypothetical protein n=1 Tax=Streptococcus porci TaxID=502567 RepID=UPI0004135D2A|nr:hypothetical protein [Streptococcus porci]
MHEEIFVFKNEDCKDNRSARLELEVIIFVDERYGIKVILQLLCLIDIGKEYYYLAVKENQDSLYEAARFYLLC